MGCLFLVCPQSPSGYPGVLSRDKLYQSSPPSERLDAPDFPPGWEYVVTMLLVDSFALRPACSRRPPEGAIVRRLRRRRLPSCDAPLAVGPTGSCPSGTFTHNHPMLFMAHPKTTPILIAPTVSR